MRKKNFHSQKTIKNIFYSLKDTMVSSVTHKHSCTRGMILSGIHCSTITLHRDVIYVVSNFYLVEYAYS